MRANKDNSTRSLLAALLLGLLSLGAQAQDLRTTMSEAEFKAAGLDKLTPAELEYLSRWLEGRAPAPAAAAPATPAAPAVSTSPAAAAPDASPEERFGREQVQREPEPDVPDQIVARLKGEFRGWDGKTVFRLDNGQVWQQRVGGKYRSRTYVDPEVVVEKGRFGYYLRLAGGGRSVGVRRLQ